MNTTLRTTLIAVATVIGAIVLFVSFILLWPSDEEAARAVAVDFGNQLKNVSLTAEEQPLKDAIQQYYAPYVTEDLLAEWLADPRSAPGRDVSSPWPDRIFIKNVTQQGKSFVLNADVLYVTSAEVATPEEDAAGVMVVTMLVTPTDDGWRIAAYEELFNEGLEGSATSTETE